MILEDNDINEEDLDKKLWQEVIDEADTQICRKYSRLFLKKAGSSEGKEEQIYLLFGILTSLKLDLDYNDQPFRNYVTLRVSWSGNIDDISDNKLELLKELVPKIEDPELRARLSDIIWVIDRDHEMAIKSVKAYIKSYYNLLDPDNWFLCIERIERAAQVASYLGKDKEHFKEVINTIEDTLDEYDGSDPLYLSEKLMDILLKQKVGNPSKYADLSEKMALKFEKKKEWRKAREYWNISARWEARKNDLNKRKQKLKSEAETYVKQANANIESDHPSYMSASSDIQSAIQALRRIGGQDTRIEELHHRLLEYQKKSREEMIRFSTEGTDISKEQEEARNVIKNKSFIEALRSLAFIVTSPDVNKLEKEVNDLAKDYPIQYLFSKAGINEKGKIVAKRSSPFSEDSDEQSLIHAEMYSQAIYHQQFFTQALIAPAHHQILLEHNIRVDDLSPIVTYNPFIPPGREEIYAKGLHAGLKGNFILSTHLLIPQLENSLRFILYNHGVITSKLDDQGIQEEENLNSLLYYSKLESILSENLVFDLQGLLVERFGSNLRNKLAHGLISTNQFSNPIVVYLWWLILHICVSFKYAFVEQLQGKDRDNEKDAD